METQIEQVQLMSQTLESSGFSPQQSNAVIKSVALAMQTFAVTPEVLDQVLDRRLGQLKTELKTEILAEVPSREEFKDLNKSINRLERTMMESNRKTLFYSLGFSLALFGALATLITIG